MQKQLPKLMRGLLLAALLLTANVSWAQTNPTAQTLPYSFTALSSATLPAGMAVHSFGAIPETRLVTNAVGNLANAGQANSGGWRPEAGNGISMLASGSASAGAVVVSLVTTGKSNITVNWRTGTILQQASRDNSIALQYRIGTTGDWTNVGTASTYSSAGKADGNFSNVFTEVLPALANDKPVVQVRWMYWGSGGTTGSRDRLAVDDIAITGSNPVIAPTVTTTAITNAANITTTSATLPGGDVTAAGSATVTARGIVWGTATAPTTANNVVNAAEGGTGAFTVAGLTALSSNTHYYYRAFATSTAGTSYGTEYSFYTKALTPGAPAIGTVNRTINSLSVIVDANGNNTDVTYSIRINGTNFVQADGTVAAAEIFRSAADWGTTIVTGLSAGTSYSFDVRAKTTDSAVIGGNTTTDYSATAAETTLPATSPTLLSDTSNINFGSPCINATATQSFTFTGTNIIGTATLTVAALDGYTYSLAANGTFTPTLTIENFTGASTTVYVRFAPLAVQSYNGNIQVEGLGGNSSAQLTIAATGEGVNTAGTVATTSAAGITQNAALLAAVTISGCSDVTAYGFEYANASGFINGTTVTANDLNNGNFSATVSGLEANATYYYKAFITDAAGTHYGNELSFTTSSLNAPVAVAATDIVQNSFTANWTAVEGATSYRIDVATNPAFRTGALATDLFFSEYVEGSGTNRALEIYNGTGASVNLSNYRISLYANGGSGANSSVILSGTLANGATYVIASSDLFYANANLVSSTITSFNGDDAVALIKISTGNFVDIIGRIGERPSGAWSADGGFRTENSTLVRKSSVTGGVTVNPSAGFPTLATEWEVYAIDTVDFLGSHTFDYANYLVDGYENKVVTGTSALVTGLAPYTEYYYRVRAFSTSNTSENSNIITALTKPAIVTWTGTPAAWQPAVALDTTIDAVIDADYATGSNGTFTAKTVTLNAGRTFTVTTGTTLTVENNIVNNAGADNFVVENNAAILQNTTAANTTAITVIKNSNALYRLDYTLWSSPVAGQTLGDFSSGTSEGRMYEYKYDYSATANAEVEQYFTVAPATAFEAGKGYLIRMPNLNPEIPGYIDGTAAYSFEGTFKGAPHNGTVAKAASIQGNRYTAVGNPYPSPISVLDFFNTNSGVVNGTSGIYFWRKRNNAQATSYATLTLAAYTANEGDPTYVPNPAEGGDVPGQASYFSGPESSWLISQGQGFLVQTAVSPTATDIVFDNAMRRPAPASGNQSFFRTSASERSRVWLNVTDSQNGFSQTAVAYLNNATTGLDYGYDGTLLNDGSSIALYSLAENTNLAIQARPAFTTNDVVVMGFNALNAGEYTISIDHKDGIFTQGQEVYLRDNLLGVTASLNQPYVFTSQAGTFTNRFEVVYTTEALGTNNPQLNAESVIVYKEGNTVNINAGTTQITNVAVYDINGRMLYSNPVNALATTISNLQVAQQVLIVEVTTVKGKVSKKIIY